MCVCVFDSYLKIIFFFYWLLSAYGEDTIFSANVEWLQIHIYLDSLLYSSGLYFMIEFLHYLKNNKQSHTYLYTEQRKEGRALKVWFIKTLWCCATSDKIPTFFKITVNIAMLTILKPNVMLLTDFKAQKEEDNSAVCFYVVCLFREYSADELIYKIFFYLKCYRT